MEDGRNTIMKRPASFLIALSLGLLTNTSMAVGLSGNSVALTPQNEKFHCELITQNSSNLQCNNKRLIKSVNHAYNLHLNENKKDVGDVVIEFITNNNGDVMSSRIINSTIQSEHTLKRIYLKSKRTQFSEDKLKNARFVYSFKHIN